MTKAPKSVLHYGGEHGVKSVLHYGQALVPLTLTVKIYPGCTQAALTICGQGICVAMALNKNV